VKALIFDCDGVIADTERDGHRVAFNTAFERMGLDVEWGEGLYGELLAVAGGKERMRYYFDVSGWPPVAEEREELIRELHEEKTRLFMEIVESGRLPVRSGVARLVDEASRQGMKLAVCSTSNERGVHLIVESLLGRSRKERFDAILAGDVVKRKKPDPAIYLLARERLGVEAQECVVVEDSRNGLLAAKAAGMKCLITKSGYTASEDFGEADLVVEELGDPPHSHVGLDDLRKL